VSCETTKGQIMIEVHPAWAPLGAARFLELVRSQYFTDVALFRCVSGFICQFGIAATPQLNEAWRAKGRIQDDPHVLKRQGLMDRGMVSFAGGGSDSRTTQLFVSLKDSHFLGKAKWETPIGQVVEGLDVVDAWFKGYGDSTRHGGHAPEQSVLTNRGSAFIRSTHNKLDFLQ
jgi:peptidyl-prolyl cis-trans isomerase A (cyclophilin A)